MATVYIAEYSALEGFPQSGRAVAPPYPTAEQTVAITTGAVSAAFGPTTRFIRIATDAGVCSIVIGPNLVAASATTANQRIPANYEGYRAVNPGDKLSCITNT